MQIRKKFCPLKSKYLKIVYEDFMYVLCITQETFLLCSKRCYKPQYVVTKKIYHKNN